MRAGGFGIIDSAARGFAAATHSFLRGYWMQLNFFWAEKRAYFFALAAFVLLGFSSGVTKPIDRFGGGSGGFINSLIALINPAMA